MNSIHILEDEVINKIAAGEVVERPASIIKELVENSIDAHASHIKVSLNDGGKKTILISDNGVGIARNQAHLAIQRHATSKINAIEDLFQVQTMGFRGEALASISAVSRMTILSYDKKKKESFKLEVKEGQKPLPQIWDHPEGTSIYVDDLFYNVPVRQKFLKTGQTEFSHCLEYIHALSLAKPYHGFTLSHNGKEKFHVSKLEKGLNGEKNKYLGKKALIARAEAVIGTNVEKFLYVCNEDSYGSFEAIISPPGEEKATSKSIFTFVNGRWVKDKTIRYGILRGYHTHLLKGCYPQVVAYLNIDPSLVDVNVHPCKTELRFQYSKEIQGSIAHAIRESLRTGSWVNHHDKSILQIDSTEFIDTKATSDNYASKEALPKILKEHVDPYKIFPAGKGSIKSGLKTYAPLSTTSYPKTENQSNQQGNLATTHTQNSPIDWQNLTYLGTIAKCYILFSHPKNLIAVDQHALHERILFEKLSKDRSFCTQNHPLLVPELIKLSPEIVENLRLKKNELSTLGFNFEEISETEIEIIGIPTILIDRPLDGLFESLGDLNEEKSCESPLTHTLSTIACHSAVRAGEELSEERINNLIMEAKSVDFFHNCPHGRNVFKVFPHKEISKWFDRI
ncbi:MAG: hypothetical protein CMP11_07025 [Zetaproteobacteria bacterium]|nr:hypothetical protein [Pseudobdellovibrionaceae bacterium]